MTGLKAGVRALGLMAASSAAAKAPAREGAKALGLAAASNAAAKATVPEGAVNKGWVEAGRTPKARPGPREPGIRVLTAVSGVDPEKTPRAADAGVDGELAELSKALKETL